MSNYSYRHSEYTTEPPHQRRNFFRRFSSYSRRSIDDGPRTARGRMRNQSASSSRTSSVDTRQSRSRSRSRARSTRQRYRSVSSRRYSRRANSQDRSRSLVRANSQTRNTLTRSLSRFSTLSGISALTGRTADSAWSDNYRYADDQRSKELRNITMAAVMAGAVEAFRLRNSPGSWSGKKGGRVATAAIGAAVADTASSKPPYKKSKRHFIKSTVAGLVADRVINGSRRRV